MAARPEDRIVAKLLATAGIVALIADRIAPLARIQDTAAPAITYHRISTSDWGGSNTTGTSGWVRVQLDCWETTDDKAWTLATLVKSALNGMSDLTGTPKITYVRCLDEQDLGEDMAGVSRVFRLSQDYRVEWMD